MLTLLIKKERKKLSAGYHQSQKLVTFVTYPNMIDEFGPSTESKFQKRAFLFTHRKFYATIDLSITNQYLLKEL